MEHLKHREESYDLNTFPLLDPFYPLVSSLIYIGGLFVLKKICRTLKTDGTSPQFTAFVFLHNILLCIYSLWTFILSWKIQIESTQKRGVFQTYCDHDEISWDQGMGYLMWLFYISKYYEYMDTLILIIKGKNPSFLQEYHHVGIVISIWALVVTRTGVGYWMMLINSGVHTVMYAYYATTVYPMTRGLLSIVKKYITMMQISQFVIAVTGLSFPIMLASFMGIYIGRTEEEYLKVCTNSYQRYSIFYTYFYLCPLIILFLSFYYTTYAPTDKPKKDTKQTESTKDSETSGRKDTKKPESTKDSETLGQKKKERNKTD